MPDTVVLTQGQRLLLEQLRHDGRLWRSPRGCHLVSPWIAWAALTDATVDALLQAGYLTLQETYGPERAVYVISQTGVLALAEEHA